MEWNRKDQHLSFIPQCEKLSRLYQFMDGKCKTSPGVMNHRQVAERPHLANLAQVTVQTANFYYKLISTESSQTNDIELFNYIVKVFHCSSHSVKMVSLNLISFLLLLRNVFASFVAPESFVR